MPQPPVGGKPYSSDSQKVSSTNIASSSPAAFCFAWSANRSRCTIGSFNSVYALQTSRLFTKSSNRSVMSGKSRWYFASGDMILGWSHTNPGFMHCDSRKSPTRVSRRRGVVCGKPHSLPTRFTVALRNALHSSLSSGIGILISNAFSKSAIMLKRLNGGVKSISTAGSSGPLAWYWILYEPFSLSTMDEMISSVIFIKSS